MNVRQALHELDLRAGATEEEIRRAYRTLVAEWHPDKYQNDPIRLRESELRIKKVNHAFEVIESIRFKTDNQTMKKTGGRKSSNARYGPKSDKRNKRNFAIACPRCSEEREIAGTKWDELIGEKVRCKGCKESFKLSNDCIVLTLDDVI